MDERRSPLTALGALARRHLPDPAPPGAARAAYLRFERARARRAALRRWWWAPALALGGAAAVAVVLRLGVPAPLAITVAGGALEEGGYVRVPVDSEASLRFSDGTVVELARASRLRVAATSHDGARLLLEEGRARASVVPRRGARWLFDAGPCRVHVTGTRFAMRWSPRDQLLEVWLESGTVTVEGPPARGGVAMRAGQHLAMDLRRSSVRLGRLGDPELASSAPGAGPATAAAAPAPAPVPAPSADGPPPPEARRLPPPDRTAGARRGESWPAQVLAGDFRSVIDEARRRGLDEVLARESAGNVTALADAARYAGEVPLARRALLRLRARFPSGPPAHRAAFLLGRLAEDQDGDLRRALQWYALYLGGPSDDVYRAEAEGRQMAATLRLSGVARARPLAAAYLGRYPHGAYAEAARAIVPP